MSSSTFSLNKGNAGHVRLIHQIESRRRSRLNFSQRLCRGCWECKRIIDFDSELNPEVFFSDTGHVADHILSRKSGGRIRPLIDDFTLLRGLFDESR